MSTHVTIVVAKPNHLTVRVHPEVKIGVQWQPDTSQPMGHSGFVAVAVGGAETFLVHGGRRLVIEEVA